jgi:hypothetical protein
MQGEISVEKAGVYECVKENRPDINRTPQLRQQVGLVKIRKGDNGKLNKNFGKKS